MTLASRLRATDVETRVAAIAALVERGSPDADELDALVDCLGHPRKAVQRPAADAFAALAAGGIAVDGLLEQALESHVPRRRWGAAFALSLVGEPPARIVPVLLEALGADDGDVRWAAAEIALRVRDRAAVTSGVRELLHAGTPPQRKMALYVLRDAGARDGDVERAVVAALDDPAWDVQLAAAATLARLALDRAAAAERLVAALGAPDARMRRAAAAALGTLGETSAAVVAALTTAAAGADPALARAAAAALRQLGA